MKSKENHFLYKIYDLKHHGEIARAFLHGWSQPKFDKILEKLIKFKSIKISIGEFVRNY